MRFLFFTAACLMVGTAVLADETPAPGSPDKPLPKPPAEEIAVQAWGGQHPDCAEWTDACVVCRRDGDAIACSTPGVACLPQPIVCRRTMQAATPAPAPPSPPPASTPETTAPKPETKPETEPETKPETKP